VSFAFLFSLLLSHPLLGFNTDGGAVVVGSFVLEGFSSRLVSSPLVFQNLNPPAAFFSFADHLFFPG
jgi:hypothetical protein